MNNQDYEELKAEVQKTMLSELFKTKKKLVNYECDIFNYAFDRAYALGKAYCAEAEAEEETLSVSRRRVQEVYSKYARYVGFKLQPLLDLFGSKCLPDNVDSSDANVDSLHGNVDSSKPKPAEATTPAILATQTNCDRLHIAAQILAGLYANELCTRHLYMEQLVEAALKATDALIAESEKGGKDA